MTSRSKDTPSKPGPPRWAMIYMLVLGVLIVWGSVVALHGYRHWWVLTYFILAAVGILAGSIKHRMGAEVRFNLPARWRYTSFQSWQIRPWCH